ncbi:MAG: tRNA pseudouridine(38-40) synthase TruA [Acidimicrobiales bacterium]
MPRARLTVAYDGSGFRGFADNAGVTTVAGTLAAAVERVCGAPVELAVAGRTDAGVHAWGQVVSFDLPADADLPRLQRSVNRICGPALVVRDATWVDDGFDARFSARWRRYRYTVVNRPVPDPFLAGTAWHVPQLLDLRAMTLACDPLIGEHDFSSFCRRPKAPAGAPEVSLVRRVRDASWVDDGDGVLRFWIRADAFCHQMVRSVTGLLVDVGMGRRRAGDVMGVLRSRDRAAAGTIAPPHGLCLWEVGY